MFSYLILLQKVEPFFIKLLHRIKFCESTKGDLDFKVCILYSTIDFWCNSVQHFQCDNTQALFLVLIFDNLDNLLLTKLLLALTYYETAARLVNLLNAFMFVLILLRVKQEKCDKSVFGNEN